MPLTLRLCEPVGASPGPLILVAVRRELSGVVREDSRKTGWLAPLRYKN